MNSDSNRLNTFAFSARNSCRACDGELESLWHLGNLALTGIFSKPGIDVPSAPLEIVHCTNCSLVQLGHDYTTDTFFGSGYGYRSGLNASMVGHLATIAKDVHRFVQLSPKDAILDIGGNDGTNISNFPDYLRKIIIDPTAENWKNFIPDDVEVIPTFFDKSSVEGVGNIKLVMSISMLYDLPDPKSFIQDIYDVLEDNGIWLTEQSDLDSMLRANAFDTICHEHLEYYSRDVLINLAEMIGFRLEYEEKNKANGGSVRFIFRKIRGSRKCSYLQATSETLEKQRKSFQRLSKHVETLKTRINALTKANARMAGLGASTKGNTLLQLLNLSQENLSHIAEVNPDKFGLVTPGTHIPIISEHESKRFDITHYLILPWHFEQTFVNKKREFGNSKLILPMPTFKMI